MLGAGDRIEVAVAGLPELDRTTTIDPDGYVVLPFVGSVRVAGETTEEVRAELAATLPDFAFSRWASDGRVYQAAIEPEAITVQIVEYGPIYVKGHVDRPGEQPFRPGLTARQALARAGGDEAGRLYSVNPTLAAADLRAEMRDLRLELTRLSAARERVAVSLGERDGLAPADDTEGGTAFAAQARQSERAELEARETRLTRDRQSIDRARALVEERLSRLRDALGREQAAAAADLETEDRVRDSYERRLSPYREVADAQRSALSSAARAEMVSAEIAQVERELEELRRAQARLGEDQRVELIEEAQGIDDRIASIRSRLQSAAEKLAYVGGLDTNATAFDETMMRVRITRIAGEDAERASADLDTQLAPGDVVSFTYPDFVLDAIIGAGSTGGVPRGGAMDGAGATDMDAASSDASGSTPDARLETSGGQAVAPLGVSGG